MISPDGIDIRPATAADAGEVLTLQRAAWVPEAQRHEWPFIPPLTQTLDELRGDIEQQTFLVAVRGTRIVGTVRAAATGADFHIGRLGVVPDLQGHGLGRRLLAAIEAEVPSGVTRFTLTTGPKSLDNITFYERHGYRRVPTDDVLVHLAKEIP